MLPETAAVPLVLSTESPPHTRRDATFRLSLWDLRQKLAGRGGQCIPREVMIAPTLGDSNG